LPTTTGDEACSANKRNGAATERCGKVVHADLHVSESSTVNASFPAGCSAQLTPDEKALISISAAALT
jgi:hypothetical protein